MWYPARCAGDGPGVWAALLTPRCLRGGNEQGEGLGGEMEHSQHPLIVWQTVAIRFITDRLRLDCDPLNPLGQNTVDSARCFKTLAERNDRALQGEVVGDLTTAMNLYEANMAACFNSLLH